MKKLITVAMIVLFANVLNAQSNYKSNWEKVQKFDNEALPKSALAEVENIYRKAKIDNNAAQIIKCVLYKSKYALILEEDAQLKIINDIKAEIAKAKAPEKNMLESILANLYWQYFQQNRYQFYNRTNTAKKVDAEDFRTWDLHTIFEEIDTHHQHALQDALILQNADLSQFDEVLHVQKGAKKFRPTVYDFIANKALDFYKTGESNLAQPAYKFEITKADFLGDNKTFLKADFSSKDTKSQKLQALKIYKNLTYFHVKDKDKTALVDLTLGRLDFVRQNARITDKETVYLETLKKLQKEYSKSSIVTEIDYRIAIYYQQEANKYAAKKDKTYQFKLRDAIAVCDAAIAKYPESNGAKKCQNLKAQIALPNVNIKNERYVEVNKESRLLVSYKNTTKLYFKVYKITPHFEEEIDKIYEYQKKLTRIKQLQKVADFSNTLKTENDYQLHTTEIIFPKLKQGEYLILASSDMNFNDKNDYAYSFIQATDIALVEENADRSYRYQIVNRFTGKPLQGANVHIKNYKVNNYNKAIDKTLVTDANGYVALTSNYHHNLVEITVNYKDSKGVFRYFKINKKDFRNKDSHNFKNNSIFVFTDRSIYRPSQTVYFKGIAIEMRENKSVVIPDRSVLVTLKDVNQQDVKTLELKTNEFGSFSGEFILPKNGLTGRYEIEIHGVESFMNKIPFMGKEGVYGNSGFWVEEYKRPKFSAKFNPVKETFKLNDSVKIKGTALAYAGSNITDAKVVYRVKRNVQYPRWWYWYKPYGFNSEAQEITHGETKTDANGIFEITFVAQPDLSVNKKDLPVFNYEIIADITDINGETRSTSTIVHVGYHSQKIDISVANKLDKTKKDNKITLNSKNLNGEFVAAKGILKIYKIKAPKFVLRNRSWAAPDYQEIPQTTFEQLFPHDVYITNTKEEEKGEMVFTAKFDTSKNKEVTLKKMKSWLSGSYVAIVESKDKFGQEITDKQRFTIASDNDKKVADKQLFDITLDKEDYKVGEDVIVKVGSASSDMTVVINVEKEDKIVATKIVHLNNEIKTVKIPVNEKDLGGFGVAYHLVNYNSFLSGMLNISVPYPKMDLEIETLTFRDKIQPASQETWSFKVKGCKKDKVVAELLTSMYDASLDQFKPHNWQFQPIYHKGYYPSSMANAGRSFGVNNFRMYQKGPKYVNITYQAYEDLNWFGLHFGYGRRFGYMAEPMLAEAKGLRIRGKRRKIAKKLKRMNRSAQQEMAAVAKAEMDEVVVTENQGFIAQNTNGNDTGGNDTDKKEEDFSNVKIRTNFNETAFFYPQLKTDAQGNVSFSFTAPESLTKWKMQLLAHTKDLHSAIKTLETITQKELMVLPNAPRFLRQGDEIILSSKIANLTAKTLNGSAQLELVDAITNKTIDIDLGNEVKTKTFRVDANGNTNVSWTLHIPENIQAVQYKIVAKAGNYSDGEQSVLPVLTNRMLVTETLPMWIRSNQTKTFTLDKLKTNSSSTLKNHKLTLEITSNPAWYAVQALPYLMEYPYDCAEQTFSKYYANTLASHIANSSPRIQEVFKQWKNSDALLSNLEKNQELKSLIIQETPWLRDAQSETEQKKRIALLFDLNKMQNEQDAAIKKLKQMQMASGGFPWFKGNRYENRYITQHIVAGFGHLDKLGVYEKQGTRSKMQEMTSRAVSYLDTQILKDYNKLLENARKIFANDTDKEQKIKDYLKQNHTSHFQVHYLYARSFYKGQKVPKKVKVALDYYTNQSYTYWKDYNLYSKGLIALIAHRNDNSTVANKVLKSLKENAITSEELGMYWKSNTSSWFWYQAPIETQALLIEAFSEIENDIKTVDNLKIWLLKNKQTNRWKTTKATTEAVYALLLQGTDWIKTTEFVEVTVGKKTINPLALEETKVEAGTGYYKTSWTGNEITPQQATVTIKKQGKGIAWGAMYWQYFEDLDKITSAETPLKLKKKLFLKTNTDRGEQLTEITGKTKLELGNLVRVRIELRVDRVMEFVHMKDMRAAGFEPINVLSRYKWQDGLGYYESTKDASTNFFFDRLSKGVYVFEYDLRVSNQGDFSNGITSIQSMYAPEFSSHSNGVRVKVK